jgi:beta-phosphoglucomutase-like phosphatase (HAD superfamily)
VNIIVDFDNTICERAVYPEAGPPKDGVKEALLELKSMGFSIIIWSCRTSRDVYPHMIERMEQMKYMKEWFLKYDMGNCYDEILMMDKPNADIYIDDRAVQFSDNWGEIVKQISSTIDGEKRG